MKRTCTLRENHRICSAAAGCSRLGPFHCVSMRISDDVPVDSQCCRSTCATVGAATSSKMLLSACLKVCKLILRPCAVFLEHRALGAKLSARFCSANMDDRARSRRATRVCARPGIRVTLPPHVTSLELVSCCLGF